LGAKRGWYCEQAERKADHCDEPSRSCFTHCRLPDPRGSIDENSRTVKGDQSNCRRITKP
jgi:hypothetical protein